MGNSISKAILIVIMGGMSLSAWAFGDEVDKKTKKINPIIKIVNKKPAKISKTEKDDTLVYDKKVVDDTLTFDDKKSTDDTLIFADDEVMLRIKPKSNHGKNEFSMVKTDNQIGLNPVIFPNPSFGQSTLEMNTADSTISEITITSQYGVLIKKEKALGKSYELNDLAAGNYIISIRQGNQVVQKRLFVK